MEAIILAGGLGTRLRSVISELPKPMAPVGGKPFLAYLLQYLGRERVDKVILATGYLHEKVKDYFQHSYLGIEIDYSREIEPLGTGGAIQKALAKVEEKKVVVLNGDTYFDVNIVDLVQKHSALQADVTLALKTLTDYDRYGNVLTQEDKIIGFASKGLRTSGTINGGIYVLQRNLFKRFQLPQKFGFEDFLMNYVNELALAAVVSDAYFIDIGVPEDYRKAQNELVLSGGDNE
ncbi:nucleotidyltransferase family protein [Paradesulfitobacterium ferrireducens]|uniref:nucleotidyltransferase family protein n=1 Tax=Paradesulfitobacterium ferrireducens TaxID=2816476 RepID=UPI001A8ED3D9|nr:nucleotidyltransferase family protein [Paradesulfitobacterium ferrireducens]